MILIKFKGLHVAIITRLIKIFKREKGLCSFSSTNHCIVVQIKSLRMPPSIIVANVSNWSGQQVIQRMAAALHSLHVLRAQVISSFSQRF